MTGVVTHLGATCDNFLSSDQKILDEAAWQSKQSEWNAGAGMACTGAETVAHYKVEIEQLCSKVVCSKELKKTLAGLQKMMNTADLNRFMVGLK